MGQPAVPLLLASSQVAVVAFLRSDYGCRALAASLFVTSQSIEVGSTVSWNLFLHWKHVLQPQHASSVLKLGVLH